MTEGGGVIRNVLEPSGISGGGTGLRPLPAANRGAPRGEAQANRKVPEGGGAAPALRRGGFGGA